MVSVSIKKDTLIALVMVSVIFLFIYNARLVFIPYIGTAKIIDFLGLFVLLGFMVSGRIQIINKRQITIVSFLFVLLILLSVASAKVHGTQDYFNVKGYFTLLVDFLLGTLFVIYCMKKFHKLNLEHFMTYYVYAAFFQALLIVAMLVVPEIKHFVFSISALEYLDKVNERTGGVRALGLAASVTYDLGILQSLGVVFISFLIREKCSAPRLMLYVVITLFLLISILVSGRSGLVGVGLAFIVVGINVFRTKLARWNSIKYTISTVGVMFGVVVIALSLLPQNYIILLERVMHFGLEIFFNYFESGELATSSTDHLFTMYIEIPQNAWLFGHGYWTDPVWGTYYMSTDVGYIRDLFFFGVIGASTLYLLYLYMFINIRNKLNIYMGGKYVLLSYALFFIFFLAHAKGSFLNSAMAPKLVFIIFFIVITQQSKVINVNRAIKKHMHNES